MSAVDHAGEVPWKPKHNPWAIAIVVTLAAFMEILDTTIVNVALPHIAGSLSSSNDEATWAFTSYLVANGIVLTISGWLSAVIGRKRYFLICISMFTVCSFLCGIAGSLAAINRFSTAARLLRRRPAAGPAINYSRHVSAGKTRRRFWCHRDRSGRRARAWPDTRRLHHRHLQLALDLLREFAGGNDRGFFRLGPCRGPALAHKNIPACRLHGPIADHAWNWLFAGYVGPWRGPGLVGIAFIRIMAVLAILGILGAISWLLIAKKPIVNLDVFKDKNFAMGSVCIGGHRRCSLRRRGRHPAVYPIDHRL